MTWLGMIDVRPPYALRLRFILDTPIPLSLGYRLLGTGPKFQHRADFAPSPPLATSAEDTEGTKFGWVQI
jgi:hypothetical protein